MGNSVSEKLVFFCFKSCLRGENDSELYDALEITDFSCDLDVIKKSYKKLSLAYHPDKLRQRGVEMTPELNQKFLKLKEAYDILSDPVKRKVYDNYGMLGLTIKENPTAVDPRQVFRNFQRNRGDRCSLAICILALFAAIGVLPVLFSLKCDGTLGGASWLAIWTPMWILDFVLLLLALTALCSKDEEEETEGMPKVTTSMKLIDLLMVVLFVTFQFFIMLKLDDVVSWKWFVVFTPWLANEVVQILSAFKAAFIESIVEPDLSTVEIVVSEDGEEGGGENDLLLKKLETQKQYYDQINTKNTTQKSVLVGALTIWFAVFLALKIDHDVSWNWGLVFLPVWVYFVALRVWVHLLVKKGEALLSSIEPEKVQKVAEGIETDPIIISKVMQSQQLMGASSGWILQQFSPMFITVMLVCRLQVPSAHYSTFIILLPIFIALGCCCCGVFCGLAALSNVDMDALDEEMLQKEERDADGNTAGTAGERGGSYSPPNAPPYGTFETDKKSDDPVTNLLNKDGDNTTTPTTNKSTESNNTAAALEEGGAQGKEESSRQVLPVTGIDQDID